MAPAHPPRTTRHRRRRGRPVPQRRTFLVLILSVALLVAIGGLVAALPSVLGIVSHSSRPPRSHPGSGDTTRDTTTSPDTTSTTGSTVAGRPPTFAVGMTTQVFDEPAPATTYDYATGATTPGRQMVTLIEYPALPRGTATNGHDLAPARQWGPYPVILFAPGYDMAPSGYEALLSSWVKAGFVVASPSFPETNPAAVSAAAAAGYPHGTPEASMVDQPGDVAFVANQVAREAGTPGSLLNGLVNTSEIALAGQSDGGTAVAALAYGTNPYYTGPSFAGPALDVRISAVAVLSGATLYDAAYSPARAGLPPLFMVQSATDACNTPQSATALYDAVNPAVKFFLLLDNAGHLAPYTGGTDATLVEDSTLGFFELELEGRGSPAALISSGTVPGMSSLAATARAPALAPVVEDGQSCYS